MFSEKKIIMLLVSFSRVNLILKWKLLITSRKLFTCLLVPIKKVSVSFTYLQDMLMLVLNICVFKFPIKLLANNSDIGLSIDNSLFYKYK